MTIYITWEEVIGKLSELAPEHMKEELEGLLKTKLTPTDLIPKLEAGRRG